jgi:hypothetical protein
LTPNPLTWHNARSMSVPTDFSMRARVVPTGDIVIIIV